MLNGPEPSVRGTAPGLGSPPWLVRASSPVEMVQVVAVQQNLLDPGAGVGRVDHVDLAALHLRDDAGVAIAVEVHQVAGRQVLEPHMPLDVAMLGVRRARKPYSGLAVDVLDQT